MEKQNNTTDKLTDKAFSRLMLTSVLGIFVCIMCLFSATWAWFSTDLSSHSNTIQSSDCDVVVSVVSVNGVEYPEGKLTLNENTEYKFEISGKGTARSAYCILVIDGVKHYTDQIPVSTEGGKIAFTLEFSKTTDVEIITRWGTSSKPDEERSFKDGMSYYDLQATDPTA